MEWTAEVSAGAWLRERLTDGWDASMHTVVPRGFPSYARVFHPPTVTWIPGARMPRAATQREMGWQDLQRLGERQQYERTTWRRVADAFGTVLHPTAQWSSLVRHDPDDPNAWQQTVAPDGRQYDAPAEGRLDADQVAALARVLAAHTDTPGDGFVAVWEGWGGLVGHVGSGPASFTSLASDGAAGDVDYIPLPPRYQFENPFHKPTWQPGILADEISKGPRLSLPDRDYVLFRGGVREFAHDDWALTVPWRDRAAEERGFAPDAENPALVWPDDRAWVWVSEIDYDSTIVAGSAELIAAVCGSPQLEALEISAEAALTYDADTVNR